MLYPWLHAAYQQISDSFYRQRLHHALLLQGPVGVGKQAFAQTLADALLCASPVNLTPCGQCKSCHLLAANSHPDRLQLGEDGNTIGVDEVRNIADFCQSSAGQNGHKVVVVFNAQNMTVAAANALLKTLEEPAKKRFLVLVCADTSRLPATILSRCAHVQLHAGDQGRVCEWLSSLNSQLETQVWHQFFTHQPLLLLKWQENNEIETIDQLYQLTQQIKNGVEPQLLVDILQQKSDYIAVFSIFISEMIKQSLIHQQIEFQVYQTCMQHLSQYQQAVDNVSGINLPLQVSELVFSLGQQLKS